MTAERAQELQGRHYVLTGASLGIGRACADAMLEAGASITMMSRGAADLERARTELAARYPGRVTALAGDVSNAADVTRLFDAVPSPLDGVVHAAGIYGPIGAVTEVDPAEWFDAIRVNLLGSMLVAREGARRATTAGRASSIVLFSGGGAATPFPNYTGYACGKAGVVRLTETMAIELGATAVRINCIAPGFVATRLHQQTLQAGAGKAGTFLENTKAQLEKGGVPPTVAADATVFLLSDRAHGITGRFLAAPYDGYAAWPEHLDALKGSDLFTLRRIVPRDRGQDWQ